MSFPAAYILLKTFYYLQKKPYSAVTVQIDRLTSEQYEENDLGGIVDLVEVIRIQDSGPSEAARAIRKKLYVATAHQAMPPLTIAPQEIWQRTPSASFPNYP